MKMLVAIALLASTLASAAPTIEATLDGNRDLQLRVVGAPLLDSSAFVLRVDGTKWIAPSKVTTFADGNNRVAIAFVLYGGEIWIGNDRYEKDLDARYDGVLNDLSILFDHYVRRFAAPAGSTITILTYADTVDVRVREMPLASLPAKSLGTQRDYRGRGGNELVKAVEHGLSELEKSTAPIKTLIVVTDGADTRPDTAQTRLRELAERGIAHGIKMHAIVYRGALRNIETDDDFSTLEPTLLVAKAPSEIEARLQAILDALSQHVDLTFPASAFAFDGRVHDLQLEIGVVTAPFRFEMPDLLPRPVVARVTEDSPRTPMLVGGVALVALALAIVLLRRRVPQ